jgi:hypothetical protein
MAVKGIAVSRLLLSIFVGNRANRGNEDNSGPAQHQRQYFDKTYRAS